MDVATLPAFVTATSRVESSRKDFPKAFKTKNYQEILSRPGDQNGGRCHSDASSKDIVIAALKRENTCIARCRSRTRSMMPALFAEAAKAAPKQDSRLSAATLDDGGDPKGSADGITHEIP